MRAGIVINVTRADRRQLRKIVAVEELARVEGTSTSGVRPSPQPLRCLGPGRPLPVGRFITDTDSKLEIFIRTAESHRLVRAIRRSKVSTGAGPIVRPIVTSI